MQKFNLRKKFGLITGAGGLLGYEHACALLEVGAGIVLTDVNAKNLNNMFYRCRSLSKSLHSWDTRNVTTMKWMFEGADCFTYKLKEWNTENTIW